MIAHEKSIEGIAAKKYKSSFIAPISFEIKRSSTVNILVKAEIRMIRNTYKRLPSSLRENSRIFSTDRVKTTIQYKIRSVNENTFHRYINFNIESILAFLRKIKAIKEAQKLINTR